MVELTYQMMLSTLQTVGLLVGIYYYVMTLQNTRKNQNLTLETRRYQMTTNWLNNMYNAEGLENALLVMDAEWSSHEEWLELLQNDREYRKAFIFIADYYNYLGMLCELDLDVIRLVCMNVGAVLFWWEKYRDVVYKERERRNNKNYCAKWEYGYNELVKYLKEHPEIAP